MRALPETENDGERNATLETAPIRGGLVTQAQILNWAHFKVQWNLKVAFYCNNVVVKRSFTSTISNSWKLFLYTFSTGIIGLYAFQSRIQAEPPNTEWLAGDQPSTLLYYFSVHLADFRPDDDWTIQFKCRRGFPSLSWYQRTLFSILQMLQQIQLSAITIVCSMRGHNKNSGLPLSAKIRGLVIRPSRKRQQWRSQGRVVARAQVGQGCMHYRNKLFLKRIFIISMRSTLF